MSRRGMMYKQMYSGDFYDTINGDIDLIRDIIADDERFEELKFVVVPHEDLIVEELYLNDNGSTVKYMGDESYEVIERTPLYFNDHVLELTDRQVKLFWTLVKNCKHGTCDGV